MKPTCEEVNAYVDDELSPADKARVAASIAHDPALARKVAVLSSLKAEIRSAFEAEEQDGESVSANSGEHGPQGVRLGGRLRLFWLAAAASLVISITVLFAIGPTSNDAPPGLLAAAMHRHATLSQAPSGRLYGGRTLVRFETGVARLPDLEAGRLSLNGVADFLTPNGEMGLAAHYRGTRGCKVTLFLVPNAETLQDSSLLGEELARTGEGAVLSYGWRHGAIGYLLLAEGMDEGRLGLIAEKLYEASRGIEMLDQKARQQLAENRRRSAPCHA